MDKAAIRELRSRVSHSDGTPCERTNRGQIVTGPNPSALSLALPAFDQALARLFRGAARLTTEDFRIALGAEVLDQYVSPTELVDTWDEDPLGALYGTTGQELIPSDRRQELLALCLERGAAG